MENELLIKENMLNTKKEQKTLIYLTVYFYSFSYSVVRVALTPVKDLCITKEILRSTGIGRPPCHLRCSVKHS